MISIHKWSFVWNRKLRFLVIIWRGRTYRRIPWWRRSVAARSTAGPAPSGERWPAVWAGEWTAPGTARTCCRRRAAGNCCSSSARTRCRPACAWTCWTAPRSSRKASYSTCVPPLLSSILRDAHSTGPAASHTHYNHEYTTVFTIFL